MLKNSEGPAHFFPRIHAHNYQSFKIAWDFECDTLTESPRLARLLLLLYCGGYE